MRRSPRAAGNREPDAITLLVAGPAGRSPDRKEPDAPVRESASNSNRCIGTAGKVMGACKYPVLNPVSLLSSNTISRTDFAVPALSQGQPGQVGQPWDRLSCPTTGNVKEAQAWLGHSSSRITMDTYVHLMQESQQGTAELVFARPAIPAVAPKGQEN